MRFYQLAQNAEKKAELMPLIRKLFMQQQAGSEKYHSEEFIKRLHVFESSSDTEVDLTFIRGVIVLNVLLKGRAEIMLENESISVLDAPGEPRLLALQDYMYDQELQIKCAPHTEMLTAVLRSLSPSAAIQKDSIDADQNAQYLKILKKELINNFSQRIKAPLNLIDASLSQLKKRVANVIGESSDLIDNAQKQVQLVADQISKNIAKSEISEGVEGLRLIPVTVEDFFNDFFKESQTSAKIQYEANCNDISFLADINKLKLAMQEITRFFLQNSLENYPHQWIARHNVRRDQLEFTLYLTFNINGTPEIFNDSTNANSISVQDNLLLVHEIVTMHKGNVQIMEKGESIKIKVIIPKNLWRINIKRLAIFMLDKDEKSQEKVREICHNKFHAASLYNYTSWVDLLKDYYEHTPELVILNPDFEYDDIKGDAALTKLIDLNSDQNVIVLSDNKWENSSPEIQDLKIFSWLPRSVSKFLLERTMSSAIDFIHKYRALSHTYKDIKMSSERDGLTGLYNRGFYDQYIQSLFKEASELNNTFSVIMTDIDNFKVYNDTNGHQMGDKCLQKFAQVIGEGLRLSDTIARYGGEEFVIVLPFTSKDNAIKLAEKIRKNVEMEPFPNEETQPLKKVSASFGVSNYPQDAQNLKDLVKHADVNLYQAKKEGRNRVVGN